MRYDAKGYTTDATLVQYKLHTASAALNNLEKDNALRATKIKIFFLVKKSASKASSPT
ncbi:hypothetical protein DSUL_60094 [Desulfovibrionales bacterium]